MVVRIRQACLEKFLVSVSKEKLDTTKHSDSVRNVLFITNVCEKARTRLRQGMRSRCIDELNGEARFVRAKRPTLKRTSPMGAAYEAKAKELFESMAEDDGDHVLARPSKRFRRVADANDRTVPDEQRSNEDEENSSNSDSSSETDSDEEDSEQSTSSEEEEIELTEVLSGLMAASNSPNAMHVDVAIR